MSILQAIFLGIVQGLAEFLPISSSGHLVLFQKIFGINEPTMTFDIFLHIATLIPVFVVFWSDIWALLRKPFQKATYLLIVGIIPLVVMALFFKDYIDKFFESGAWIGVNFLITGVLLVLADSVKTGRKTLDTMKFTDAAVVGTMQALAVVPAISRSGATIFGSLFMGLDREAAAKYSFLLSIPAIIGGFIFQLKDVITGHENFFELGMVPMLCGFLAAMVSGFFAIKVMLKVIKTSRFIYFAAYVSVVGALVIFDQTVFHMFF